MAINIRQKIGEELSFVSLSNETTATDVIIDTAGLKQGEHTLILESFDQASDGVESTLKTDTIIVIVFEPPIEDIVSDPPTNDIIEDPSLACFADDLTVEVITSGEKVEWFLP